MIRIRTLSVILLLLIIPSLLNAQRWKRSRYEFSFGVGASNFLGELGGANQIGTHYFKDFEWSLTNLAVAVGLRYKLTDYFALNSHITYGRISGNDALTEEFFRHNRNLSFFSDIYEFNINFEGAYQEEQLGQLHHFKGHRGTHGYEIYTYAFAGVGVFYFDPKATYNGKTYRLQPLGTEGQGWDPNKSRYSLVQFCIPVGLGFKYTLDRVWGVGLELGFRKTFTDYLDDVSTTYYDFSKSPGAPKIAATLADRSEDAEPANPYKAFTKPGDQRGDPKEKDSYMFAVFSVNMKIQSSGRGLPRF
jgi:hypothetical protein